MLAPAMVMIMTGEVVESVTVSKAIRSVVLKGDQTSKLMAQH